MILELDSLSKSFGRRRVLTGATLSVAADEVVFLAGRNGAGKSTTLGIATGLVRADSGFVRYRGEYLETPRLDRLARRGLFFLPDHGLLADRMPVARQVSLAAALGGGRHLADGAVAALDLGSLLQQPGAALSGGERRRAEMAMALVRRPSCFLADEPFRGIAPKDRGLLMTAVETIARTGAGVVVAGHDAEPLLSVADRVVWLRRGRTCPLGSPESAARDPGFRARYLGGEP